MNCLLFREDKRLARRLCGLGATVAAAFASIATSYGPDQSSVSLPDYGFDLAPGSPETRRQFRVESDEGRYYLDLRVTTVNPVSPALRLQAFDDTGMPVELKSQPSSYHEAERAELHVLVDLPCPKISFPCVHSFVAIASADALSDSSSSGILSIVARFDGNFSEDTYLAIEPQ